MNPWCVKIVVCILFSAAALLLLRNSQSPQYTHNKFTGSYINDDFTTNCVCGICLEDIDITTDENKVFSLPCRHKFHRECLKKLFAEQRTNRRCPYCRRHIHENAVSLYLVN